MATTANISWNTFNAGELSPLIDGRTDQDKYFAGAKTMLNMLPLVQGPARRRGGGRYIATTKSNGRAWLRRFRFSTSQSYMLEFGNTYLRFFVNRGQLLSAGVPYEISTPWASADLITVNNTFALRTAQLDDVMWIANANGTIAPYKLTRLGATNWTLAVVPFANGPFNNVDPTNTITVQASAATGAGITLTASSAIFLAQHVGTSFYMETKDPSKVKPWEPAKSVTSGDIRRYEGNVYQATNTATTGTNPPVHLRGDGIDGDGGVTWTYLHSTVGWAKITAIGGGGTTATATVVSRLPDEVVSTTTTRWAHSVFNSTAGWPTGVTFFRGRLVYCKGRSLFMSVVGDFDNFSKFDGPDVTKETALNLPIASDGIDALRWVADSGKALLAGASAAELAVAEQTTQNVFAADNAQAQRQTEYGSQLLAPVRVGDAVLFLQRGGKVLREIKYSFEIDRYKADDLSVLSPHVIEAGIIDMDFAQQPNAILACVLADGKMGVLTYNRERGVVALAPWQIGGKTDATPTFAFVESVGAMPSPNEKSDDIWYIAQRKINGSTVRYVEYVEDERLAETGIENGFFLDAGITYSGAAATTITGLGHLEGETVQVLADGTPHADCVVASGQITLTRAATKVHIGYNSRSILQTMRPEAGVRDGSGQTRRRSVAQIILRLDKTLGGKVGPSLDKLDALPYLSPALNVGTANSLFTGDKQITSPAKFETDGWIYVVQDQPLPMTVVSIYARMQVND